MNALLSAHRLIHLNEAPQDRTARTRRSVHGCAPIIKKIPRQTMKSKASEKYRRQKSTWTWKTPVPSRSFMTIRLSAIDRQIWRRPLNQRRRQLDQHSDLIDVSKRPMARADAGGNCGQTIDSEFDLPPPPGSAAGKFVRHDLGKPRRRLSDDPRPMIHWAEGLAAFSRLINMTLRRNHAMGPPIPAGNLMTAAPLTSTRCHASSPGRGRRPG
jgi:hypothetical protein